MVTPKRFGSFSLSIMLLFVLLLCFTPACVATVANAPYDPLDQQCFEISTECSPLLPVSHSDVQFPHGLPNLGALSGSASHVPQTGLSASMCRAFDKHITDALEDNGGCFVRVTAISMMMDDGCLEGLSVFMVCICPDAHCAGSKILNGVYVLTGGAGIRSA